MIYCKGHWYATEEEIKNIPAADVVPVRHGRWIPDKEDVEWGIVLFITDALNVKNDPILTKRNIGLFYRPTAPTAGREWMETENEIDGKNKRRRGVSI